MKRPSARSTRAPLGLVAVLAARGGCGTSSGPALPAGASLRVLQTIFTAVHAVHHPARLAEFTL